MQKNMFSDSPQITKNLEIFKKCIQKIIKQGKNLCEWKISSLTLTFLLILCNNIVTNSNLEKNKTKFEKMKCTYYHFQKKKWYRNALFVPNGSAFITSNNFAGQIKMKFSKPCPRVKPSIHVSYLIDWKCDKLQDIKEWTKSD